MESISIMCRLCLGIDRNRIDLFKGGDSDDYSQQLAVLQIQVEMI